MCLVPTNIKKLYFIPEIDSASSQFVDLQIFAAPRLTLKPLVPAFPCFGKISVSLMEKVRKFHFNSRF